MRLFHGTTTARLPDILDEGLVPQPCFDNPDRIGIYLTDSRSSADLYANLAQLRRGGRQVVVELDSSVLDGMHVEPDDYELQNHIDDLHDPERTDEIGTITGLEVDERLRDYRSWQDVPADICLAVTNQILYTATIPAEALLNLEALYDEAERAATHLSPPSPKF